ncbi:MAG: 3-hydroxyacyl-CoA dehydrogenase NAD-binding domain-containing protein [Acidobacteriota bacterium]
MMKPIRTAAVLGAGTMGAQIAAHLANAGVKVLLLDVVPGDGPRNALADRGKALAQKADPAAFYEKDLGALVGTGNFDDDLPRLRDCDWVIEAIVENLEIKRSLFAKVEAAIGPETIVTSNTSGISIAKLGAGRSDSFRRRFFGTHFFNPPRYLHLLELIPGPDSDPAVVDRIAGFADLALGKGIVRAKDTPCFIANRIGIFGAMRALGAFSEEGLSYGEVDRITGPLVGRAKSGTFRTFDIVGLDVVMHVARDVYDEAKGDERRTAFVAPDFVQRMVAERRLGDKTGQGFFKKVKGAAGESTILALDPQSFEYVPQGKPKLPSVDMVAQIDDLGERLRGLVFGKDRVASFLSKTLLETLAYAAARVPEIADDVVAIDRAMRWGFGWRTGPFETWDLLGVEKTLPLLEARGVAVPRLVSSLLSSGRKTFYAKEDGRRRYFDVARGMLPEPGVPGLVLLSSLHEEQRVVKKNAGASLLDLGDGVGCVEFHSKMNAIGGDTLAMLKAGLDALSTHFDALVVANDGDSFSVGANLMLLLLEAQEGNFDEIDLMIRQIQKIHLACKHAPKPVVVAPFGMTLGGGLEVVLHGTAVQAAAESYMGLVEVGVGLIPAAGGTKELYLRMLARGLDEPSAMRAAFETIGLAKVGKSAHEGRALGFLKGGDGITVNRDRLVSDAKALALSIASRGYAPGAPRTDIPALGASGVALAKLGLHQMLRGGYISPYDAHIGAKLAHVLAGGSLSARTTITEERMLDLEREAFLSLSGERRTLERIQHMLKTGKPLRN